MKSLAKNYWENIHTEIERSTLQNDGLLSGNLGLVWYYYYLAKITENQNYAEKAMELIEQIFENLNTEPKLVGASFENGIAGFCYIITLLNKEGFLDIDIDEELADFDSYLFETALKWIENNKIDYLHGAFGVVFYFSERLSNQVVYEYADSLIKKVLAKAIHDNNGWRLPTAVAETEKEINFSLSHGLSSFLLILMNIHQKGLTIKGIEEILRDALKFIRSYQTEVDAQNEKFSAFPFSINLATEEALLGNRLAWCYGDLNIVLLLYRAAAFLQDDALKKLGDSLGETTLTRHSETATLAIDAHFCHGSAGVAQVYHRLYKITGNEPYKTAYTFWINKTLAFIGTDLQNQTFKNKEAELLEGWVGVALTLQTYLAEEDLDWDKVFLL